MSDQKNLREELENKIVNDPSDVDAKLSLATLHMLDNNPDATFSLYYDILDCDPENAEAYLGLGLAWGFSILENIPAADIHGEDVDEEELLINAIEFLERSIELDPESTVALNALARLYIVRSLENEAIDMFKQSLLLDQAQHDILEELQKLTGTPVWKLLEKDVYMGEFDE